MVHSLHRASFSIFQPGTTLAEPGEVANLTGKFRWEADRHKYTCLLRGIHCQNMQAAREGMIAVIF